MHGGFAFAARDPPPPPPPLSASSSRFACVGSLGVCSRCTCSPRLCSFRPFVSMSSSSSSTAAAGTQHLNETHKSQVLQYLKFFQAKREENGKEIEAVFEEQKDMRYNQQRQTRSEHESIHCGYRISSVRTVKHMPTRQRQWQCEHRSIEQS